MDTSYIKLATKLSYDLGLTQIPIEFVLVALIPEGARVSSRLRESLISKTGNSDYEYFEFLGDRVVGLVINEYVYTNYENAKDAIKYNHELIESNKFFQCIMDKGNYCQRLNTKKCGDRFEALIGSIYSYYLSFDEENAYPRVRDWLYSAFGLDKSIDKAMDSGSVIC